MDGKGKVIMLRYAEGSASTANREEGFLDGMKEYGPEVELLSTTQYAGATMEQAFKAAHNLLNRFAEIDGIFCPNESSTQGMLRALQTSRRAGTITFVGFDSNETLLKALRDGELHGLALQSPFRMGYLGVTTAVKVINGEPVDKRIDTGVTMLTAENMDAPAMKELVNPPLAEYLDE
jgi:ribose transport system substrate-binding protein